MTFLYRNVFGFDVSKYQDDPNTAQMIDFSTMRGCGASFVILRIGQGNFIDRDWHKNIINSRGYLPRAGYWFFDPAHDPELQADLCTTAIGNERLEGRIWLDLEFWWQGNWSAPRYWRTFQDRIKAAGFRTGIYTRATWWNAYSRGADMNYFGREPLWQAQYPSLTDVLSGFPEPMMHQDGTFVMGEEAGVESKEIDHNRWNSNYSFADEWNVPPNDGETENQMLKGKVIKLTNIRAARTQFSSDLGDLLAGDIVEWEEESTGSDGLVWISLISATRNGLPVRCTDGSNVAGRFCWANNVEEINPPAAELPNRFALSMDGVNFKWYVAE